MKNQLICSIFFCLLTVHTAWGQNKPDMPVIDISGETQRQVVIAQGTPEIYQGHPTSLLMPDGKTIFVVWSVPHAGPAGQMAQSGDGGKTWTRLDDMMPTGFKKHRACPCIYRMVSSEGKERLWVISGQHRMPRILSEDGGKTWREVEPIGVPCVLTFNSVIEKNPGQQDGKYVGFYHHKVGLDGKIMDDELQPGYLEVALMETNDAGMTWSEPKIICSIRGSDPCEPFGFWSPDKKEICLLIRDNNHANKRSIMMFSGDHAETWSQPGSTPWGLIGHRHWGVYAPDGRFVCAFRDTAPGSPMKDHFIAWVGTYNDIKACRPGQFRIKLLHSYAKMDCGYPGIQVLPDGTIFALTYIKYQPDQNKQSVVGTFFKLNDNGVAPISEPRP